MYPFIGFAVGFGLCKLFEDSYFKYGFIKGGE